MKKINFMSDLPKIFFIVFAAVLCAGPALAASITVSWDANEEPDISHYIVKYGTASGTYSNSVNVAGTSYTASNLEDGRTYYFVVQAVDFAGQIGPASDEVSISIPSAGGDGDDSSDDWFSSQDWIELGSVSIDHNWKRVTLNKNFSNPVVIVGPPTKNGFDPCVIRLRNVTSNSFEIRIQEWTYLDGVHISETVSYAVVEAGTHMLSDGTMWEAGTYELEGTLNWKHVWFQSSFNAAPLVFQSVQSSNGKQTVTVRERNITAEGFDAALQEEELLTDGHVSETIGYLAVELNASDIVARSISCNHKFKTIDSMISVEIQVEEECSKDIETIHRNETVASMLVEGHVFAQIQTFNGADTAALRIKSSGFDSDNGNSDYKWYQKQDWLEIGSVMVDHDWRKVTLKKYFKNPVVIAGPPTLNGSDPCVVRIRNVASNSFEIRVQEWTYLDGAHVAETVSYLVVEAGIHKLPDGSFWEAGTYKIDGTLAWNLRAFDHSFDAIPLLFQSVQTFNGKQTVTVRERSVTGSSFEASLQEEERLKDGHVNERIGYLAVDSKTTEFFAKSLKCNNEMAGVGAKTPIKIRVEEEQSTDHEVLHVDEDVSVMLIGDQVFAQIQSFFGRDTASLRRSE